MEVIKRKNFKIWNNTITDFVELENQSKSNLQKQLEFKFLKLERLNSDLVRGFEEKRNH